MLDKAGKGNIQKYILLNFSSVTMKKSFITLTTGLMSVDFFHLQYKLECLSLASFVLFFVCE